MGYHLFISFVKRQNLKGDEDGLRLRMRKIFFAGMILLFSSSVYGDSKKRVSEVLPGPGKIFVYTARKLGIPILNVSIKITNGSSSDPGRPLSQIQAFVHSLNGLGVFFRMHNRFTSTMEAGTCFPVQYVNRPNLDFRGFCGTVASGVFHKGDTITALPSGKSSKIK